MVIQFTHIPSTILHYFSVSIWYSWLFFFIYGWKRWTMYNWLQTGQNCTFLIRLKKLILAIKKALYVSFNRHPIILGYSRRFHFYSKSKGTMSHQQTSLILKSRFLVDSIEFVPFPPIGDHILARYCKWICLPLHWVLTF